MASSEAAASVLDASALLAHLNDEKGAPAVRQFMGDGAAISVVNWMEVLSKIAERGEDPELAAAEMKGAGLIGGVRTVEAVTEQDSIEIARLRPLTKEQGLFLADRSCLALAARLGLPVVTGDRAWQNLPRVGVPVKLIRLSGFLPFRPSRPSKRLRKGLRTNLRICRTKPPRFPGQNKGAPCI